MLHMTGFSSREKIKEVKKIVTLRLKAYLKKWIAVDKYADIAMITSDGIEYWI